MNNFLYPPSPTGVNHEKLAPSLSFRKQVGKTMGSIILFLIVYILLILAATALAICCFYAAISVFLALPGFITIVVGVGLVCVGVSVIFFLIKFIFTVTKDQKPSRVEITESEQPRLFAFIRQLSGETQTPLPKKIFISPDVNACVFYNSGFWSMFLPVRKNLEIGLGLVNSVNISEFKAVIAHEFGHFSQRSMKLGSFTYNVNRVIYNMLFDNTSYSNFLGTWGRLHGYLAFFAFITIKIATGIQQILKEMYRFINRNYMGLSREMEFHADAVAASVSGGNNLVSSLSRIEIAENCYQDALRNANTWLAQNKISKNIFSNQLSILRSWAQEHALPMKQGLPEVSYQFIKSYSSSRVNYMNQWASHPTLEERTMRLEKLSINVEPDEASAWTLFEYADNLQEQMTKNLYRLVKLAENPEIEDEAYFEECQLKEKDKYDLPSAYKGFYNKRYIDINNWDIDDLVLTIPTKNFEQLFNNENGSLQSAISKNENDLAIIKAIKGKKIDVKTFDFDGKKHVFADCDEIIDEIEKEITQQHGQQQTLDKEAFVFFFKNAKEKAVEIENGYRKFQLVSKEYEVYKEAVNSIIEIIRPFYEGSSTLEKINAGISAIKVVHEKTVKEVFKKLLHEKIISASSNESLYTGVKNFIEKDYAYFIPNEFQNDELNELRDLTMKVADVFNDYKFIIFKEVLEEQVATSFPI